MESRRYTSELMLVHAAIIAARARQIRSHDHARSIRAKFVHSAVVSLWYI